MRWRDLRLSRAAPHPYGGFTSGWARVGGVRLHVRERTGPDAGPGYVLVHGLAVSHRYLTPTAARLRRPVAIPDLAGFGLSDKPVRVLRVPDHARVLADWLDARGAGPVRGQRARAGRPVAARPVAGGSAPGADPRPRRPRRRPPRTMRSPPPARRSRRRPTGSSTGRRRSGEPAERLPAAAVFALAAALAAALVLVAAGRRGVRGIAGGRGGAGRAEYRRRAELSVQPEHGGQRVGAGVAAGQGQLGRGARRQGGGLRRGGDGRTVLAPFNGLGRVDALAAGQVQRQPPTRGVRPAGVADPDGRGEAAAGVAGDPVGSGAGR